MSILQRASHCLNAILGLFYPEVCQLCAQQRAGAARGYVCEGCRGKVQRIQKPFCSRCGMPFQGQIEATFECFNCRDLELPFTCARSAAMARGELLEIIHRYKYKRALWFEPYLAELLNEAASRELGRDWNWIVPVPLHPTKQREREFNQAERLARCLSRGMGIPMRAKALRRVVQTQSQTLLTREERRENVAKAFSLRDGADLAGSRIVLVDDVFTTGATTAACARVLLKAGAAEVCVWTVARGI